MKKFSFFGFAYFCGGPSSKEFGGREAGTGSGRENVALAALLFHDRHTC